jgi:hypothetical protein
MVWCWCDCVWSGDCVEPLTQCSTTPDNTGGGADVGPMYIRWPNIGSTNRVIWEPILPRPLSPYGSPASL